MEGKPQLPILVHDNPAYCNGIISLSEFGLVGKFGVEPKAKYFKIIQICVHTVETSDGWSMNNSLIQSANYYWNIKPRCNGLIIEIGLRPDGETNF